MSEAIIVALITGACAIISQIVISARNSRELYAKLDRQSELSDERIWSELRVIKTEVEELTREVREHNNFARRTPVLEEKMQNAEKDIAELKRRVG